MTVELGLVLRALVAFTFVMGAAYAGTLRALEVYFDPDKHSIFLSSDSEPPAVESRDDGGADEKTDRTRDDGGDDGRTGNGGTGDTAPGDD